MSANWTNPHRLPARIFTWTNSPCWLKTCLRWSSVTFRVQIANKNLQLRFMSQTSLKERISILQRNTHSCIIWIILVLWALRFRILIWSCMFKTKVKIWKMWTQKEAIHGKKKQEQSKKKTEDTQHKSLFQK